MRALPDKWNPRLSLRDWINRPSQAELAEREEGARASRALFDELSKQSDLPSRAPHSALISPVAPLRPQTLATNVPVAPEACSGTPADWSSRSHGLTRLEDNASRNPGLPSGSDVQQEATPGRTR